MDVAQLHRCFSDARSKRREHDRHDRQQLVAGVFRCAFQRDGRVPDGVCHHKIPFCGAHCAGHHQYHHHDHPHHGRIALAVPHLPCAGYAQFAADPHRVFRRVRLDQPVYDGVFQKPFVGIRRSCAHGRRQSLYHSFPHHAAARPGADRGFVYHAGGLYLERLYDGAALFG